MNGETECYFARAVENRARSLGRRGHRPLGVRRSIAGFAIKDVAKFHPHHFEACRNGFHLKIIGPLFRP